MKRMDTIIWLISNHQIYVGDFYKGELKAIPFEKADTWEVYGADDIEKLVDYMNYPLHYNQFKNSKLVILFDEVKVYEMLRKIERCFKNCEAIVIKRIEPFLLQTLLKEGIRAEQRIEFAGRSYELAEEGEGSLLRPCLEEEEDGETVENPSLNPMALYEYILQLIEEGQIKMQSVEEVFKYDLILSPTTLYIKGGQKEKRYLQVEDIVMRDTIVAEGTILSKGEELFKYKHHVQKMFRRIKTEEIAKQVTKAGKIHFVKAFDENQLIWVLKDEVIGIIGEAASTHEEVMEWYQKNMVGK
jgi:hypothetical protein